MTLTINESKTKKFSDLAVGALFKVFITGSVFMKTQVKDKINTVSMSNGLTYHTADTEEIYSVTGELSITS